MDGTARRRRRPSTANAGRGKGRSRRQRPPSATSSISAVEGPRRTERRLTIRPKSAQPSGRLVPAKWQRQPFLPEVKSEVPQRHSWQQFVWARMHNWFLHSTGPNMSAKEKYDIIYRTRHVRHEHVMREIEMASGFTFDVSVFEDIFYKLNRNEITKFAAKRLARQHLEQALSKRVEDQVFFAKGILGMKGREAPNGSWKNRKSEPSKKISSSVRDAAYAALCDAIDDEWNVIKWDGHIGPSLRWNSMHTESSVSSSAAMDYDSGDDSSVTSAASSHLSFTFRCSERKEGVRRSKRPTTPLVHSRIEELIRRSRGAPRRHLRKMLSRDDVKAWSAGLGAPFDLRVDSLDLSSSSLHGSVTAQALFAENALGESLSRHFLVHLSLCRCGLAPASATALARALSKPDIVLSTLLLRSNPLTRGEKLHPSMPSDIRCEYVTSGINMLFRAVAFSHTIRKLDISRCDIREQGVKILATHLRSAARRQMPFDSSTGRRMPQTYGALEDLDISCNNIGNKGAISISMLSYGERAVLKRIDVAHNRILEAGLHAFFKPPENPDSIYSLRAIEYLVLRSNAMSEKVLSAIVVNLRFGWSKLQVLDLSRIKIGSRGAMQLAELVSPKRSRIVPIRVLLLSHCQLTSGTEDMEGMRVFLSALSPENECLRHLDISNNGLVRRKFGLFDDDDSLIYKIGELARNMSSLSFLDLRGNGIGIKARLALRESIKEVPISPLSRPQKIAFWMCKQVRLGAKSPARRLWYGMLLYICSFLGEERQILF